MCFTGRLHSSSWSPIQIISFPILIATPELNTCFLSELHRPDKAWLQCTWVAPTLCKPLQIIQNRLFSASITVNFLAAVSLPIFFPPPGMSSSSNFHRSISIHIIHSFIHSCQILMSAKRRWPMAVWVFAPSLHLGDRIVTQNPTAEHFLKSLPPTFCHLL